jgi:hypothetical protein
MARQGALRRQERRVAQIQLDLFMTEAQVRALQQLRNPTRSVVALLASSPRVRSCQR